MKRLNNVYIRSRSANNGTSRRAGGGGEGKAITIDFTSEERCLPAKYAVIIRVYLTMNFGA